MNRFNTQGIVLTRTNYGEADRIITFLTPDRGKVRAMAKGVRKSKSKLAGGIELFSVSDLGLVIGRGEINTLISSRLAKHYGNIVKDLDRTNAGYDLIKILNKATEDEPELAYFELLNSAFAALDDSNIDLQLVRTWFEAQVIKLAGHTPNIQTEKSGQKLTAGQKYDFNLDTMSFQPGRQYSTDQIKFLRLLFGANPPAVLQKVGGSAQLAAKLQKPIRSVLQNYIRL
ncbi:MAG TPA: DNA repair protein RecO [Candidatus Saccharimonadales bacterium]|nr:DNA repair protein RecO [Candidatus Saccharimonadales bacterium]